MGALCPSSMPSGCHSAGPLTASMCGVPMGQKCHLVPSQSRKDRHLIKLSVTQELQVSARLLRALAFQYSCFRFFY